MELWLWAVVGGLAGTVLMDLAAIAAEKLNITRGGRCGGPQGLWVHGTIGGSSFPLPCFFEQSENLTFFHDLSASNAAHFQFIENRARDFGQLFALGIELRDSGRNA